MNLQFPCCVPGNEMNNVALNKPATHSSECCGGAAERAVDGNSATSWGGGSCSHSGGGNTWWQVDLEESYYIGTVKIFHRTDCCGDRLVGGTVHLSSTPDYTTDSTECFEIGAGPEFTSTCSASIGRYLTVVDVRLTAAIPMDNPYCSCKLTRVRRQDGIITICELQVHAARAPAGLVDAPHICECRDTWSLAPSYTVCAVAGGVGTQVALGSPETCMWSARNRWSSVPVYRPLTLGKEYQVMINPVTITNPAISFANLPAAPTIELAAEEATLVETPEPGLSVMTNRTVPCPLAREIAPGALTFLQHGDNYYKHQPVSRWAENTLESPASRPVDFAPVSHGLQLHSPWVTPTAAVS